MTLEKKTTKGFILSLALGTLLMGTTAEAANVKIINNSNLNLRVDAISDPGDISYCKSCYDKRADICGKQSSTILVPADAFGGCGSFSIVDMRSGFLGSGKCKHLSVLKNYEVTFFETTLGTCCEAKEIQI